MCGRECAFGAFVYIIIDLVDFDTIIQLDGVYASTPSASSFTLASPGLPLDQSGFFCKFRNEKGHTHTRKKKEQEEKK